MLTENWAEKRLHSRVYPTSALPLPPQNAGVTDQGARAVCAVLRPRHRCCHTRKRAPDSLAHSCAAARAAQRQQRRRERVDDGQLLGGRCYI
ncbi:hypothetical protein LINJ_30_0510 [Leishmania infantum JPCM5]|uniref:Uncharacterized protein n=3 Tax=Leishmania donovani species complex TaxID=38574 RepID=E9AHJ7_LEIIN|nr:hypothetical protein LINJ_30_0510 [Leishmania infantum JPCM5]XP_003862765.1 hypothetical protein LDBPK_300510 [Leishmania donovani]CAC9512033.1 hypothetical_protein [Leishmania infantum]CBZ08882.1 hypothetical protein LINJ_30_0510 [Leishmania infantum JPCM5]CBZ36073.1 hypothetical protein LDBPK_300510 [Leishmania donovani]SUZ43864.1 hypothetical_protein [Leishmania infantum]|eukprot:XP_003392698.1 hypothetical protein LINJ_30_0510 [Leishmania infantum JPCM5]